MFINSSSNNLTPITCYHKSHIFMRNNYKIHWESGIALFLQVSLISGLIEEAGFSSLLLHSVCFGHLSYSQWKIDMMVIKANCVLVLSQKQLTPEGAQGAALRITVDPLPVLCSESFHPLSCNSSSFILRFKGFFSPFWVIFFPSFKYE